MHRQLAEKEDGFANWGYSKSTGTSFVEGDDRVEKGGKQWLQDGGSRAEVAGSHEFKQGEDGPAWLLKKEGEKVEVLSEDGSVAQV